METVLIIEDDPTMLRGLKDNFAYAGFNVLTAADGEAGLTAALDESPDLIILDIMLPEINGYEICRIVRDKGIDIPIIMLTAKGEEADIVLGLNLGADDYVTKPFSIKELLARSNAFLRRKRTEDDTTYTFGPFALNISNNTFTRDGEDVILTPREFKLLACLCRNHGRVLTRDHLLDAVWGYGCFVTDRTVDRFMSTLRSKIQPNPEDMQFIRTIRNIGYRFTTETTL
ncbi:MAG TPA: response regulator transcription factor [Phycisphaerales bacterium]|nr:response regulator transcription factor [Phycisphaerales bacterium]